LNNHDGSAVAALTGAARPASPDPQDSQLDRPQWLAMLPFVGVQLAAIVGVIIKGWSWTGLLLALAIYVVRMFGLTAGFHRYLSHRSFKTSRAFQFVLALIGTTSTQKGPLWWAAHHRAHHKYSDGPRDIHSVRQRGFFWAHVGWILVGRYHETDWDRIKDFAKYPELRWLNKYHLVPVVALAAALFALGGSWALLWGFAVSTTLLWHGTFCVNSLAHVFGRRRYETTDDSRNSFLIALFTLGEGWHNNHHHYQRSERQGFYWWELDITHAVLTFLSWFGVVWELHEPPRHVRDRRAAQPAAADGGELGAALAAAVAEPTLRSEAAEAPG
jgi:stearoyl-CoA desaturase (delta-9 desaturase)